MNRCTNLKPCRIVFHIVLLTSHIGRQMLDTQQLLYQTEKSSYRRFSIKTVFLKTLQYSRENTCRELLRTPISKNICARLLLNWLHEVAVWSFVCGSHLKASWLCNITKKKQSLSNQSFSEICHTCLYLTLTLSCEPRFCIFVINGYYTKSKCL